MVKTLVIYFLGLFGYNNRAHEFILHLNFIPVQRHDRGRSAAIATMKSNWYVGGF